MLWRVCEPQGRERKRGQKDRGAATRGLCENSARSPLWGVRFQVRFESDHRTQEIGEGEPQPAFSSVRQLTEPAEGGRAIVRLPRHPTFSHRLTGAAPIIPSYCSAGVFVLGSLAVEGRPLLMV